jgi:hypothetical protein
MTLITVAALTALGEWMWRAQGHVAGLSDDKILWATHRSRVYSDDGRKRLVVVGSSRAQLGIVPASLREVFPEYDVVHLAIDGTSSNGVFRDLCRDSLFDGILLLGTTASGILRMRDEGEIKADEYVRYFREDFRSCASLDERVDIWIGSALQSALVSFSPGLTVDRIIRARLHPPPSVGAMDADRFRPTFYRTRMTPAELAKSRKMRVDHATSRMEWKVPRGEFERSVRGDVRISYEALRRRGGMAVVVQLPMTDQCWRTDSLTAPKEMYWDSITAWAGIPTVHFRDHPALAAFDCPDASHLDAEDAPVFTRRLAMIIREILVTSRRGPSSGRVK